MYNPAGRLFNLGFGLVYVGILTIGGSYTHDLAAKKNSKLKLAAPLTQDLNMVLRSANDLHSASVKKDRSKMGSALKSTVTNINSALRKVALAKEQKTHVQRLLTAAKAKIEMTQNSKGAQKTENLREAFAELVKIAKSIELDNYMVFFCGKDKTVWLQKSIQPSHPLEPSKLKGCGRPVN